MARCNLRIAVLTSSRADYSYYRPLMMKLRSDSYFNLQIIAFGTHLSEKYGKTVSAILSDGFEVNYQLDTTPVDNSPESISRSIGLAISEFSKIWEQIKNSIDLIICLGDRYEMFAGVAASIPFNIPVAHLYGGDVTLGAIDDVFRNSITTMSKYHFTSLDSSKVRVSEIKGSAENVYKVGSLSLDNLNEINLLTKEQFKIQFSIEVEKPILVTFHPETVRYRDNELYVNELIAALETLDGQIIITLPNADTMSGIVRENLLEFSSSRSNVFAVESLGTKGYFSCLNHCDFLIGNSSSGIVEAASFGKYVINIGDRQKGREAGNNVIHVPIKKEAIINAVSQIKSKSPLGKENIYGDGRTSERIVAVLKSISTSSSKS